MLNQQPIHTKHSRYNLFGFFDYIEIFPTSVFDIGSNIFSHNFSTYFAKSGALLTIVDPRVEVIKNLQKHCDVNIVRFHNFGIWQEDSLVKFYDIGILTCAQDLYFRSEARMGGFSKKDSDIVEFPCYNFNKVDEGNIDFLFLDCCGSEWYVLKNMISTPRIIAVNLHISKDIFRYVNPFIYQIRKWLEENSYLTLGSMQRYQFFIRKNLESKVSKKIKLSPISF